jgi:hypothetical protein
MTNKFELNGKTYPVWLNHKGYPCLTIYEGGQSTVYFAHRVVWERHYGPVPEGYELHHIDHDRANWSVGNLMPVDRKTHRELHRQARSAEVNQPEADLEKNGKADRRRPGDQALSEVRRSPEDQG